ncbi:TPA: glycosyltransferase, partial [Streptococcus suis]
MKSTVLLSAYNGSLFLKEQLDSIINQTRQADEIILIDDCSVDDGNTLLILESYKEKHENIKVVKNSSNLGWATSFVNGIKYVSNEIVFFADQDDVWDLKKIENMMDMMERHNLTILMSAVEYVNRDLQPIRQNNYSGKLVSDKFYFDEHFIYSKGVGAAMCFRKDFLIQYSELWNPQIGHDRFFQIMGVCFSTIHYLDLPLLQHRVHENNATGKRVFSRNDRILGINGNIELITTIKKSIFGVELKPNLKIIDDY